MNKQIKIQPKSSITNVNIVKELKSRNTEFHTYKPKQERSFKIKDLGHTVTNIWNIKKQGTKKVLRMFYVELKQKSNNKDIYEVYSLLDCRVKFESSYPKHEIPQCINCQRYGHMKNFYFRKARCVKCAGNHPTIAQGR